MTAAAMRAAAARVASLPERMVDAAAAELVDAIDRRVVADTGGDRRMSGRPRRAIAVRVRYGRGVRLASAVLTPSPGAQWTWLEVGTRPHVIGRRRDGRGLHLRTPDGWRTGPVAVAGTAGKRTWTRGTAAGMPAARRAMAAMLGEAVR